MASNADSLVESIADYVSAQLQLPIQFIADIPWQEKEQQFDRGNIQICWLCGLPYTWKADNPLSELELLAAPVVQGRRYRNQPVYYSDIVVHHDSHIQTFADLEGSCWAYNHPHSYSGCYVMRHHLFAIGKDRRFLGEIIESGAHQNSLQLILNRQVDAAAIDSYVLALELKNNPDLDSEIRVIDTLGPSPIPPWIISKSVPLKLRQALKTVFLEMHQNLRGQAILASGHLSHFTPIEDRDYHPMRQGAQKAEQVDWP